MRHPKARAQVYARKLSIETKGETIQDLLKCNQAFDSPPDDGRCKGCHAQADDRRLVIIELARNEHRRDGELEIDDNAQLSEGSDNGCYVQAWVWVSFAATECDREKEKSEKTDERPQATEPAR